ncbi:[citrate (pro-3S)-lyase] ligase [candidate division KSB3 bacterium]|uniref:[Citrate [pro-3S]-lyase] ligase n=1 Tax=candidate division KSB3 bacterium TaxID=2044937 RepID=A0A2G6E4R9_9BACT|nr:MAG: [citrate (pro-3S)-lyase] ligase [candidate division KSB3 bacterium]PIE29627.1 MAG: [citrate (pro-3S)-lyase] ligase [candidate division KSB3 bacterium]
MSHSALYHEETLNPQNPYAVKKLTRFLSSLGFQYSASDVDYTMILYDAQGFIAGTGSYQGQILKYVVVEPEHRGKNAASLIVTHLIKILMTRYQQMFAFTRPENAAVFEGLGFQEVATAEPLYTLLEFGYRSIRDYQTYLRRHKAHQATSNIASIVMNCNPFSNGHKFLIETAASENDIVYVFVVEEDRSVFPFADRWHLVNEGIRHLPNVISVKGGQYVVSGATFPSYFLQKESVDQIVEYQTRLDVTIFAKHIVPVLGINKRYVGTEPYSPTTQAYNTAMKRILPSYGVQVIEVERKAEGTDTENKPNYISATKIRRAIQHDRLSTILHFLPETTRKYLLSDASQSVRAALTARSGDKLIR